MKTLSNLVFTLLGIALLAALVAGAYYALIRTEKGDRLLIKKIMHHRYLISTDAKSESLESKEKRKFCDWRVTKF